MMKSKNKVVLGIYKTRSEVDKAIDAIKDLGFSASDISVLVPETSGSQELGMSKSSKAPEGVTAGVGTGAVIGGAIGLLAGIGALAIPGIGPFIAAGPIMGALAGLGVGGAVGGVTGALIGFGIPEYEAKRYEGFVKAGGILLSVHADTTEEVKRAKGCLVSTGAVDVSSTGERKGDWNSTHIPSKNAKDSTFKNNTMSTEK